MLMPEDMFLQEREQSIFRSAQINLQGLEWEIYPESESACCIAIVSCESKEAKYK